MKVLKYACLMIVQSVSGLLNDFLYEIILVFVFLFLCVGYLSHYFSKYYNIYFSLLGIPYNYRKNKYTLEYKHPDPNC